MSTNDKLAPGMVLGRYELLLPIAQGGMATVWAARQKGSRGFQKTVAVKTMLPTLSDDPQFEQMFLDEAALASNAFFTRLVQAVVEAPGARPWQPPPPRLGRATAAHGQQ